MKTMKYRLISAAMVLAPILSTGIASTVHANPVNNTKTAVVYKFNYSFENFKAQIHKLTTQGEITSSQEAKVLAAFKSGGNYEVKLHSLTVSHVISNYQESKILDLFKVSSPAVTPNKAKSSTPLKSASVQA